MLKDSGRNALTDREMALVSEASNSSAIAQTQKHLSNTLSGKETIGSIQMLRSLNEERFKRKVTKSISQSPEPFTKSKLNHKNTSPNKNHIHPTTHLPPSTLQPRNTHSTLQSPNKSPPKILSNPKRISHPKQISSPLKNNTKKLYYQTTQKNINSQIKTKPTTAPSHKKSIKMQMTMDSAFDLYLSKNKILNLEEEWKYIKSHSQPRNSSKNRDSITTNASQLNHSQLQPPQITNLNAAHNMFNNSHNRSCNNGNPISTSIQNQNTKFMNKNVSKFISNEKSPKKSFTPILKAKKKTMVKQTPTFVKNNSNEECFVQRYSSIESKDESIGENMSQKYFDINSSSNENTDRILMNIIDDMSVSQTKNANTKQPKNKTITNQKCKTTASPQFGKRKTENKYKKQITGEICLLELENSGLSERKDNKSFEKNDLCTSYTSIHSNSFNSSFPQNDSFLNQNKKDQVKPKTKTTYKITPPPKHNPKGGFIPKFKNSSPTYTQNKSNNTSTKTINQLNQNKTTQSKREQRRENKAKAVTARTSNKKLNYVYSTNLEIPKESPERKNEGINQIYVNNYNSAHSNSNHKENVNLMKGKSFTLEVSGEGINIAKSTNPYKMHGQYFKKGPSSKEEKNEDNKGRSHSNTSFEMRDNDTSDLLKKAREIHLNLRMDSPAKQNSFFKNKSQSPINASINKGGQSEKRIRKIEINLKNEEPIKEIISSKSNNKSFNIAESKIAEETKPRPPLPEMDKEKRKIKNYLELQKVNQKLKEIKIGLVSKGILLNHSTTTANNKTNSNKKAPDRSNSFNGSIDLYEKEKKSPKFTNKQSGTLLESSMEIIKKYTTENTHEKKEEYKIKGKGKPFKALAKNSPTKPNQGYASIKEPNNSSKNCIIKKKSPLKIDFSRSKSSGSTNKYLKDTIAYSKKSPQEKGFYNLNLNQKDVYKDSKSSKSLETQNGSALSYHKISTSTNQGNSISRNYNKRSTKAKIDSKRKHSEVYHQVIEIDLSKIGSPQPNLKVSMNRSQNSIQKSPEITIASKLIKLAYPKEPSARIPHPSMKTQIHHSQQENLNIQKFQFSSQKKYNKGVLNMKSIAGKENTQNDAKIRLEQLLEASLKKQASKNDTLNIYKEILKANEKMKTPAKDMK